MRNHLTMTFVLGVLLFSGPYTPDAAASHCECRRIRTQPYTCTGPGGCEQVIMINVCYGFPNSCVDCTDAWNWIPCCSHFIGSAASLGQCNGPLAPSGQSQAAAGTEKDLERLYVPSCQGGYVPAFPSSSAGG